MVCHMSTVENLNQILLFLFGLCMELMLIEAVVNCQFYAIVWPRALQIKLLNKSSKVSSHQSLTKFDIELIF